jgi:hypothetical protein
MAGNTITYDIDDTGIGVFDGFFTAHECDYYIQFWKMAKECNMTLMHGAAAEGHQLVADDERANVIPPRAMGHDITYNTGVFINRFWEKIYPIYSEKFRLNRYRMTVNTMKVQKTLPGEGYHSWHTEKSPTYIERLWSVILYLNDVAEGGETELLVQKKRIEPRMGRVLIFPATYTHIHRGNPPLSGEKYIMTMWGEYASYEDVENL